MADVIHFHCPACGISLRVPPAAAGFRGPCPRCREEIIGPDPDLGLDARRATAISPPAPTTPLETFPPPAFPDPAEPSSPFAKRPAAESPAAAPADDPAPTTKVPVPESEATQESSPPPAPAPTVPVAAEPPSLRRTVFVLSCLVAALLGLMAGFLIGMRQSPDSTSSPPAANPPAPAEAPSTPAASPPEPTPPEPPAETTPPEPQSEQGKATPPSPAPEAPAESALKAFLAAPDWQSRAEFVLHPERIREKMEAYHEEAPDGPTVATSVRVDAKRAEPDQAVHLYSFQVATREFPDGFPVAVVETPAGWKVDWETFVEFRDDHFQRFASGEGSEIGAFHVLVRNTHYFGEKFPGIENLTAFRIDPPQPDRTQYAFVPTGSDLHKLLAGSTEWGAPCAPVLELVRKTREDGKSHIEITGIVAPNWRPALH